MKEKGGLENLLRSRNLKVTSRRLELLTIISNYTSAIPYSKIQKSLKNFDRVTLYRTLKVLLDGGIIHKAFVNNDDVYYARCRQHCTSDCHDHKHIHLKCTVCREVSCVDVIHPVQIKIPNVIIKQIEIEVSGVCENCI
ncbi:MAG: transcriptional repressor [Wenyingzhuangia sp.]|jgi:Fur family transcriptional regulator, ferric uptake regulator|uniref:Fur family transcriptional regulator n=1 Tax=Wenyingzhuangia sp. TaxID=1964193 RepID=UPI00321AE4AA